jgi:hypothetical protein
MPEMLSRVHADRQLLPDHEPLARVALMSIDIYARVWKYAADRRGTRKLLLLALAEFADTLGICWPSHDTLATMLTEDRDYVRKLIGQAKDDGDMFVRPGQGRGNPTIYGIAVGLACQERQRLAMIVQHTVVRKNVRYLEIDGQRIAYTPGSEEQLFTGKGVLQSPFLDGENAPDVENSATASPPAVPKSRPTRRPAAEPEHIRWLRLEEGIISAPEFAHLDPEALIADYKNRRAENQHKGTIVKLWREYPPTKENYYRGRQDETNQPSRPVNPAPSQRRPKPGEPGYY